MRKWGWIGATLLMFAIESAFGGRTFVVATNGNDANAGTVDQPWRSVAKANVTLQAGDTVYIREGAYSDVIMPKNSGTPGASVVYARYPSETATLLGESAEMKGVVGIGWDLISNAQGAPKSYIIVDGLVIRYQYAYQYTGHANRFGYVQIANPESNYNTIRNCTIVQNGDALDNYVTGHSQAGVLVTDAKHTLIEGNDISGTWLGVWLSGAPPSYTVVRGNRIHDVGASTIDIADPETGQDGYQGNLIEFNVLSGSAIEDGIQFESNYQGDPALSTSNRGTIVRYNVIRGCAENALDLKGTSNIVVEGNIIYGNTGNDNGPIDGNDRQGGIGGLMHGSNTTSKDIIVRNNIFYDNLSGLLLEAGYKVYNNDVLSNNRDYTGPNSTFSEGPGRGFNGLVAFKGPRVSIKNNIFAYHADGQIALNLQGLTSLAIDNNLYWSSADVHLTDIAGNTYAPYGLEAWRQRLAARGFTGGDARSMQADPLFEGAPPRLSGEYPRSSFSLSSVSPAIDAGGELTRTVGGGNGTSITVADAGYFCDGYGIVPGDSIVVGTNIPVGILSIDYANQVLHVDRAIVWSSDAPINRPFAGAAPDIGALETGGTAPGVQAPAAPALLSPADSTTGVAVTTQIQWAASPTATSNQVQVSTSSSFLANVIDQSGITGTSYPLSSLGFSTTYFWRVRAWNAGGASPWSSVRQFTTATAPVVVQPPAAPALLSPADSTTGVAVTAQMQWAASPTATSNQVQVSTSSSFLANVIDQSGITGTSYSLSSLGFSTTYFWRVRASNAAGASPWSSVRQFATVADTGTPPKGTGNVVANGGFESGAAGWSYSTKGSGSFAVASPGFEGSLAGMINITQAGDSMQLFQAGIILEPATIYRLAFTAYSDSAHAFTIGLLKNTAPYTNYGLPARKFVLRKKYTSFSTYFQTSNFTTTVNDARLQIWFGGYAAAGDEYRIDNVTIVRSSAPSKPPAPQFVSPTAAASDQPIALDVVWTGAADADTYTLQLATDSLFTTTVVDTVVSDTAVSVGPLRAGIRYYRRVRGTNISGDGDYCSVCTFSTEAQKKDGNPGTTQPTLLALAQNYPNPFNPSTAVQYSLSANSHVTLKVYSVLGREVVTLVDGDRSAGTHEVIFDASRCASGVYFYTLRTAEDTQTRRMVLIR